MGREMCLSHARDIQCMLVPSDPPFTLRWGLCCQASFSFIKFQKSETNLHAGKLNGLVHWRSHSRNRQHSPNETGNCITIGRHVPCSACFDNPQKLFQFPGFKKGTCQRNGTHYLMKLQLHLQWENVGYTLLGWLSSDLFTRIAPHLVRMHQLWFDPGWVSSTSRAQATKPALSSPYTVTMFL
jgi:hypothetical protein